jgi:uncharacterized MAPEG superfamily protein
MDGFTAYGPALAALSVLVLIWAGLGPVSAIAKEKAGAAPGGAVPQDYTNPAYRWDRAFANLVEGLGAFAAAAAAAILAGGAPGWVNVLAWVVVAGRVAMAIVHVRGIGKPSGGLRSILFTLSWGGTIGLAVVALVAVL